jgi:hypothetical protein
MKKNSIGNEKEGILLVFAILLLSMTSCATNELYPYLITHVKRGRQNQWVMENISEYGSKGTIYTQFIPLTANKAALLTVGKINNKSVAQVIIPIIPGSINTSDSWSFIELGNEHFDAKLEHPTPWDDAIYIRIFNPKKFIKTLQQQKIFKSKLMFNMDIYGCNINGYLEIF